MGYITSMVNETERARLIRLVDNLCMAAQIAFDVAQTPNADEHDIRAEMKAYYDAREALLEELGL
jgi:hypothetical protein